MKRLWRVLAVALFAAGCPDARPPETPMDVLRAVQAALHSGDIGAIIGLCDRTYSDDLGGPGRLEDDLRQLITVYGPIAFGLEDWRWTGEHLEGHATVTGRRLRFEGPVAIAIGVSAQGPLIRSGLLTDLRGQLYALRLRRLGLESGSIERLDEVLSMDYPNRAALLERLRGDLAAARDTALIVEQVTIDASPERALVVQSYLLVTHIADQTIERRDRERLNLQKEGTRWRIAQGLG